MIQVEIKGSYITAADINEIITKARSSDPNQKKVTFEILARKKLEEIEISFIGYLMLLLEKFPHLQFELNFEYNFQKKDPEFFRKLTQFGTYAYLMLQRNPFVLKLKDASIHFNIKEYSSFPENWLVHSDSFMLLFLISRKRKFVYESFFEISFAELTKEHPVDKHNEFIRWDNDDDHLFQLYNKAIIASSDTREPDNCLINLGRIAFYKSLRNAGFLVKFLQAGELEPEWIKTKSLFLEMAAMPLIYTFVFTTLSAKEVLREQDHYDRLESIWTFTKDFVSGLRELVKNIDEHVSNNCGVVAAQVFKGKSDNEAAPDSFIKRYLQTDKTGQKDNVALYTSVFDLGEKGIVPTLIESTDRGWKRLQNAGDNTAGLFEKDLRILSSKDFKIDELFDTINPSRLYQQCKRHLVHCGLLRLASLIKSNAGDLLVFTSSRFGRTRFSTPDVPINSQEEVLFGTCINMVLPIRRRTGFTSPLQHYLPTDSTKMDIKGIEELLSLRKVPFGESSNWGGATTKTVIEYEVAYSTIQGDEDELRLWQGIEGNIRESKIYEDKERLLVLCIGLDKASLDGSQLLRLAGNLEFSFPDLPVIFKGISVDKLLEFVDINKTISKLSQTLDFWNITNPLIIVSYLENQLLGRFYFTDVLWGKSFYCNLELNRRVARAHFNITSSTYEREEVAGSSPQKCLMSAIKSPIIDSNGVLLPLDLLFMEADQRTLFEQNAFILLQNEFK